MAQLEGGAVQGLIELQKPNYAWVGISYTLFKFDIPIWSQLERVTNNRYFRMGVEETWQNFYSIYNF